jgi:hypothetical protein
MIVPVQHEKHEFYLFEGSRWQEQAHGVQMAAFDMVHVVPSSVTFVERIERHQRMLK